MQAKELESSDGRRTFVLAFGIGDEVSDGLLAFAREHRIRAAHFTAIGALSDVTLGYWKWESKEYTRILVHEQVEVLSLVGNVALGPNGEPKVHAHLVVGKADGTAHGGHLLEGHVRPTLEVVLVEAPTELRRSIDAETGLPLIDLRA